MTDTTTPHGPYNLNRTYASFSCHVAPNGGWVLQHLGDFREVPTLIAAFSDSADLIKFLDEKVSNEGLNTPENFSKDVQLIVGSRKP